MRKCKGYHVGTVLAIKVITEKQGGIILKRESMIEKNMNSTDAFVKNLYTDLHGRIQDYEREESSVKKMSKIDALPEIVTIGGFSIYLLMVIF
ncbi:Uncharacterised protein [Bacillus freudenreichii]|nr:Uncharacterised protein [Bacillus freudenreichii]